MSPIETVNADEYEGGYRTNINPIISAYDGSHYESLETLSPEDDKKAIALVNQVKTNGYTLKRTQIATRARISQSKNQKFAQLKNQRARPRSKKGNKG